MDWIWRPEPHKVHMGDLDRYVFTDDYIPQLAPSGAHEIYFKHPQGMLFKGYIQGLGDLLIACRCCIIYEYY
jgi:hypothetical protein